jgi:membrane dipeptidase
MMGTQGLAFIGQDLQRLRTMYRLGFRVFGLSGSFADLYGDPSSEHRDAGLSLLGRELVAAVNELPVILDLAHSGRRTLPDTLQLARAPVSSHANTFAVEPTNRNRSDEELRAIADKGGVCGVCALPRAVKEKDPSIRDMLDHIDHALRVAGPKAVGLGLDLMEGFRENKVKSPALVRRRTLRPDIFGTLDDFFNDEIPHGFTGISALPRLTAGMLGRGHSRETVAAVLGRNWLEAVRRFIG